MPGRVERVRRVGQEGVVRPQPVLHDGPGGRQRLPGARLSAVVRRVLRLTVRDEIISATVPPCLMNALRVATSPPTQHRVNGWYSNSQMSSSSSTSCRVGSPKSASVASKKRRSAARFSRKLYANMIRPLPFRISHTPSSVSASASCVASSFWYNASEHRTTSFFPTRATASASPHLSGSTATGQLAGDSLARAFARSRGSSEGRSVRVTEAAPRRAATRPVRFG
mmetsp:Transcript_6474/g.26343  ORF Transcript_6474/g.26343 Transcript_6474/m.26343 type:complete len:225 (-) Transcript_6474:46-720(-)